MKDYIAQNEARRINVIETDSEEITELINSIFTD